MKPSGSVWVSQTVTIAGSNFMSANGQIVAHVDGQVAPTSCPEASTCTVTVPTLSGVSSSSTVPITVTTDSGTSNSLRFSYQ